MSPAGRDSKDSSEPALNLREFLPYQISIVANRISAALARLYSERFDLGIPEWRVMAVLGQRPGLSADEVCAATCMEKVPVSRAVAKLLSRRLLERDFSGRDRRRSVLRLSRQGDVVYRRIVPLALAFEADLKTALSRREQRQLREILAKLAGRRDEDPAAA